MVRIVKYQIFIAIITAAVLSSCNSNDQGETKVYEVPEEVKQIPFGTNYGLRAPDIELPDANGETKQLSDLHGKLVLLDFWASWCNPCRQENPHLVKVYDKYNNEEFTEGDGFEIYSVSLDRNEEAWRAAIEEDGLDWPYNVGDMKGARTEAAIDYGIQMIPMNYLLDKNGVIIATNLRGDALDEKLAELLK